MVTEVDNEKSLHINDASHGILNGMYSRGQFEIYEEKFMSVDDVPTEFTFVRECNEKSSITGGQGYFECNYQHSKIGKIA